jgi:hypothetical protein
MLSSASTSIDRETLDVIDFLSDMGGLIESFKFIFGFLAFPFSAARMNALLANRLYHVSTTADKLTKDIMGHSDGNSNKLNTRPNGDVEIGVPFFLDWELLWHKVCCCLRKKTFKSY